MQMTQAGALQVLAAHGPSYLWGGPHTRWEMARIQCMCSDRHLSREEYAIHLTEQLALVAEVVQETVTSGWTPMCGCAQCQTDRAAHKAWPDSLARTMSLCSECGNKRCPKATWHVNECTGSNEPGQPGSAYVP